MVGRWDKLGYSILFENLTLVVRWAGLKDTHYLGGLRYDSDNYNYGKVGLWSKSNLPVIISSFYSHILCCNICLKKDRQCGDEN